MKTTPEQSNDSVIDTVTLIRVIAASVLFAVSLVLKLPAYLQIILLAVAAITAGFDVAVSAFVSVQNREFFATPVIILVVTLSAFIAGFRIEGTALILLYQLGAVLLIYFQERARKAALSHINSRNTGIYEHLSYIINDKASTQTSIAAQLEHSAASVLKLGVVIGVLFAVIVPLVTGVSYSLSIHRALVIILVCNTGSIIASLSTVAGEGLCLCTEQGIVANNAESLSALADIELAVFDKSGVFCDGSPRIISVEPTRLDKANFITFAAHAVYYSEQPFAQAVGELYTKDYRLELIGNFIELPGFGVELSIGGAPVIFARRSYFEKRGVELPTESFEHGLAYYMTIAGQYVGRIILSAEFNSASENLVRDSREAGVGKCVLLTEDSLEESEEFADELNFNNLFSGCDTEAKLNTIEELTARSAGKVMYVYSKGIQTHSAADIDIRVGNKSKFADIIVFPEYISNLPAALGLAKRINAVTTANALIVFIVKALLIFLAITGYCNLWLAALIDSAAAIATVCTADRVSKESLLSIYKYKAGK